MGDEFEVRNFGIGGATLIKAGRPNVWQRLEEVEQFQPHVIVIALGTNDTVGGNRRNWERIEHFERDYSELIQRLSALETKPQIWVCTPTAMVLETPDLSAEPLANLTERKPRLQELCQRIRALAKEHRGRNVQALELNAVLQQRPEWLTPGDGAHPNADGYLAIAQAVAAAVRARQPNIVLFLVDDMGWQDTLVPFYTDPSE